MTHNQEKDVHTEHCCIYHGCKYNNDDCPVVTRQKVQSFPCEDCDHEEEIYDEPTGKFTSEVQVAFGYVSALHMEGVLTATQDTDNPTSHPHLLWMLKEITDNPSMSRTKKNRWLGYVQGCLVKDGILDVNEERENTRNIFKGD